jgi:DNA end-binding protein Ku
MAARAIYKATVRFGGFAVPVKLYTAVGDIGIHFRLLHDADGVPLRRQMVCPLHQAPVPPEHQVKGYPVAGDEYVVLTRDELDSIAPASARSIDVDACVNAAAIDPRWLERTYYLGPDGREPAYAALVRALRDGGRACICRWRMRRRDYVGALTAGAPDTPPVLLLVTLRHGDEVVPVGKLDMPAGDKPRDKELETARYLVQALAADFRPEQYHDQRRARLIELLERKARGESIRIEAPQQKPVTSDDRLLEQLQASLEAARRG